MLQQSFPDTSQVLPMDGYHFANVELARLGRAGRKGAPGSATGQKAPKALYARS